MSKLTVDIILEECGEEVLGKFIRNTIAANSLRNPWQFVGWEGIYAAFLWSNTPEGAGFWTYIGRVIGGRHWP